MINFLKVIELNLTELCNLRCNFCPRSSFYPNQDLHMNLQTAQTILNHLQKINYRNYISIAGRGEPTLAKNFADISELFIDAGFKLTCSTNGKNVDNYLEVLTRYEIVAYDVYDEDIDKFNAITKKYKEYKNFIFKHIPANTDWNNTRNFTNRAGSFEYNKLPKDKTCDRPITKMFIDYNGDYKLCCEDWKEKITLGNVHSESIEDYITKNLKLNEFREELLFGDRSKSPCDKCTYKRKHLGLEEMSLASEAHFNLPINNLLT